MVTINISSNTKERFKILKLNISSSKGVVITEDKLLNILMDKIENGL